MNQSQIVPISSIPLSRREFLAANLLRIFGQGFSITISTLAILSIIEAERGRDSPFYQGGSSIIGCSTLTLVSNRLRDTLTSTPGEYSLIHKGAAALGAIIGLIQTILGVLGATKTFPQPPAAWPLMSGLAIPCLIITDWRKGQGRLYNTGKSIALTLTLGGAMLGATSIIESDSVPFGQAASLSLILGYVMTAIMRGRDVYSHKHSNALNRAGVVLSILFYSAGALSSLLGTTGKIEVLIGTSMLFASLGFLAFGLANMIFRKIPTTSTTGTPWVEASLRLEPHTQRSSSPLPFG